MTESMLVAAQPAYVYPRLAELADLRGDDRASRRQLRDDGRGPARRRCARNWIGRGWYSRG